jgi:hypothetical protein
VLEGEEFLRELRGYVRGNAREQCEAGHLSLARPSLAEVIGELEVMKGKKWLEFLGPARRQRAGLGFVWGATGLRADAWGTGGGVRDAGLRRGISGDSPL